MPGAADEAELHPGGGIDDGEELFVASRVDDDVGEHRYPRRGERVFHEVRVQHLDRHVLDARAVFGEVAFHGRVVAWSDEHDGHAAGIGGHDVGVFGRAHGKAERRGERTRGGEVGDGDDDVIDAHGDGVERARERVGDLRRWRRRMVVGDFDAMGLGEDRAKDLLGEVGIDSGVDGELAAAREHLAHARRLDHTGGGAGLHLGDLATDVHALGEQCDDRCVDLVDLVAQLAEFLGHPYRLHHERRVCGCISRSTCLASTSISMFTCSPGRRTPSVVTA